MHEPCYIISLALFHICSIIVTGANVIYLSSDNDIALTGDEVAYFELPYQPSDTDIELTVTVLAGGVVMYVSNIARASEALYCANITSGSVALSPAELTSYSPDDYTLYITIISQAEESTITLTAKNEHRSKTVA